MSPSLAAVLAFKAAMLLDPTLKVAKQNAHNTMHGIVKGASVLDVLAVLAVKLKLFWVLWLAHSLVAIPWVLLMLATGLAICVVVLKIRGVRRMRSLARKDPQLLALYQRLKADKKAARI